jgi:hypothetical protein
MFAPWQGFTGLRWKADRSDGARRTIIKVVCADRGVVDWEQGVVVRARGRGNTEGYLTMRNDQA